MTEAEFDALPEGLKLLRLAINCDLAQEQAIAEGDSTLAVLCGYIAREIRKDAVTYRNIEVPDGVAKDLSGGSVRRPSEGPFIPCSGTLPDR